MDPWYDYLVLPGALLVLLGQMAALLVTRRQLRVTLAAAGFGLLAVIFLAVLVLPFATGDSTANVGAGLMLFVLFGSGGVLSSAMRHR